MKWPEAYLRDSRLAIVEGYGRLIASGPVHWNASGNYYRISSSYPPKHFARFLPVQWSNKPWQHRSDFYHDNGRTSIYQGKTTVILLLVDYLLILLTMLLWLIQSDRDHGFTMRLCLPHKPREFEMVSGPLVTRHTPFLLYGHFYKSCWHCKAFPCSIYTPRLYSHEQTITMNTEVRRVRMQIQNAIGHFQSCKTSSAEGK